MRKIFVPLLLFAVLLSGCREKGGIRSTEVWVTSAAGQKCAKDKDVVFREGIADNAIAVLPYQRKQEIDGFGNSITESSAFVLACLSPKQRHEVIEEMYGAKGANFTATRTVLGSSDFTLKGHYSYDDVAGDTALEHFSLAVHQDGFNRAEYLQIRDESFDMWQFIHEVAAGKAAQQDSEWRLIASPWSPPAWMKDNGLFYDKQNRYGGALLPQHYETFAQYFVRYLQAYRESGIEFWAVTPENEPQGNDGSWESLHLSPQDEARFIGRHLGPAMEANGFGHVRILGFDQNTFEAAPYTDAIFSDPLAEPYTDGVALHWYGSTVSCFPEVLDSLHAAHPDKRLLHTEGCIDNLGRDGWPGVSDYAGYKESGWFGNDDFWWTPSATDWAYSTPWWPEWHPKYAAVHRYAGYIIDGLNHWLTGFIDWNCVLDSIGGPTHVQNNCGAEVMIDYARGVIYYTPYFYVLKQFSRSMRPGDVVLGVSEPVRGTIHLCAVEKSDGSYAVNILNTGEATSFPLQIGAYSADIAMPANAVKTIIVRLPRTGYTQKHIDAEVESLLRRMTLEEKIGQMNQLDPSWLAEEKEALIRQGRVGSIFNIVGAKEVNRLQRMAVEETRLGIPLLPARDVIHGFRTIYPIPLGQAATWNPQLVEQASRLTAREAMSEGIRWAFSPMVDVAHDPRWGRVAEGYGEDTYLTATMGAAVVRGYQNPEAIRRDEYRIDGMAACVKHFAGYSVSEGGRDYNTTWIPEVQLRDVYLPPFKAALDAGAASIMCSFNDLNGLPSSANAHLNKDILRDEWQSDALLVSDWGSGSDLVPHGLTADKCEAAKRCINARMEMDMQGNIYTDYLPSLVESGEVKISQIDECVRSILRLKFRLGLFDNPYVEEGPSAAYSAAALATATRMVEQSAILLKNDGVLPLREPKTILVCGPLADQQKEQLGTWVFDGEPAHSVTPLAALRQWAEANSDCRILFEPGLQYSRDTRTAGIQQAVAKARQADVVLCFCGEEAILSGEARCRADISLPGEQTQLIDELAATGKPVVMIVMAGRPLTIGHEMERAAAVLYSFHGGTMAGPGLANLLTGRAVPSGKTTITFPKMVGQVPLYYTRHNTGRPSYEPPMLIDSIPIGCPQFSIGQSSYWLETPVEPLVPFGFGLSYTGFAYSDISVSGQLQKDGTDSLLVECTITNTGAYDAYEVAQLYTRQLSGDLVRPLRELRGFDKVFIPAGESRTVRFALHPQDLAYWHEEHRGLESRVWQATDAADYQVWVSPDSRCQTAPKTFSVKD